MLRGTKHLTTRSSLVSYRMNITTMTPRRMSKTNTIGDEEKTNEGTEREIEVKVQSLVSLIILKMITLAM